MSEKNINDQLKAKIDQIDFDTKINQVTDAAHKAFEQIREQAATLLSGNRSTVDDIIDKATVAFDEKTEGKYHDKVTRAKASFASGLDRLSEDAPAPDAATDSAGDATVADTDSADGVWAQATSPQADAAEPAADDNPFYPEADHVGDDSREA